MRDNLDIINFRVRSAAYYDAAYDWTDQDKTDESRYNATYYEIGEAMGSNH
jgi:hypothetical protein